MSDSLQPYGLESTRLVRPWNCPGKNTGVGCHFLLQGIFLTQGSNPGLLHGRQTLYSLSHQGSLQDLLELTPKKDVLFITGDWNVKVGSQETLGVTCKFGFGIWNEAGQRLIEFCQGNVLVITNSLFQQHKRKLYTWTSPDGQHRNETDYILCSQKWRSSTQSAETRPGADCGSDHELLIAKLRLKLKKVGKTARPFRYGLNQIPYDYTVEVRNRFKGLDLIEYLMNYGWRFITLYRKQGTLR